MVKKYFIPTTFLSVLIYLISLASCNLINPPLSIPCYGHIDTMDITTAYPLQGTASSAITCAWVYVDDQPVGAFDLPCTFPMISSSGSHLITIFPGITADGISATREKDPFYTYYNSTVYIKQDSVTKFKFTPTYATSTVFDWMEDFESHGVTIVTYTPQTSTTASLTTVGKPDAYEGNSSGEILLDSNASVNNILYTGVSLDTFNLPHDGSAVFMEINYNTNNTFGVGLFTGYSTNITQLPILVEVYPTTGWKKMYIDLGPSIANQTGPFSVYFTMQRQTGLTQAKLLLDNIKLMHLKGA